MTDGVSDQQVTNDAPATPPPSPATPSSAPAPQQVADIQDDEGLDLLNTGHEDDGDEGSGGAAPAADPESAPAWQRPEGLEGDALTEWKESVGLPTEAGAYEVKLDLREGETITETGQQLIDGLKSFAVENDLPAPAVSSLVKWYDAQVKGLQAKLAEGDSTQRTATRATLQEQWGDSYTNRMEFAREGAHVLPVALRKALRGARTADGRAVEHLPEFAIALYEIGKLRTRKGPNVPPSDDQRLAEIQNVMRTDIDAYRAKGLDQEHMALMRRREAPQARPGTLTPAEAAEEREITQLMHDDIGAYRHKMWRGSGRTASERAMELARKRAGEAA